MCAWDRRPESGSPSAAFLHSAQQGQRCLGIECPGCNASASMILRSAIVEPLAGLGRRNRGDSATISISCVLKQRLAAARHASFSSTKLVGISILSVEPSSREYANVRGLERPPSSVGHWNSMSNSVGSGCSSPGQGKRRERVRWGFPILLNAQTRAYGDQGGLGGCGRLWLTKGCFH